MATPEPFYLQEGTYLQYDKTVIMYANPLQPTPISTNMSINITGITAETMLYLFESVASDRYEYHQVMLDTRLTDEGLHCFFFLHDSGNLQYVEYEGEDVIFNLAGYRSVTVMGTHVDCIVYSFVTISMDTLDTVQINCYYDRDALVLVKTIETRFRGSFLSTQITQELTATNISLHYNQNLLLIFLMNGWEILLGWFMAFLVVGVIILLFARTLLKAREIQ